MQQWTWNLITPITSQNLYLFSFIIALQILFKKIERSNAYMYTSGHMSAPCLAPKPSSIHFEIFCQFNYHSIPYVCDPSGVLSRTEIELLDHYIHPLNFTSCFCADEFCITSKPRISIIVVSSTNIESLGICDVSMEYTRPFTLAAAALIYAEELAYHWSDGCRADLMIVYINSFDQGKQKKPYLVPLYRHKYEHLSQYSHPIGVVKGKSVYLAISDYLKGIHRIIETEPIEMRTSVPHWAIFISFIFLTLAFASAYVSNCITNRVNTSYFLAKPSTNNTIRLANDRWRAGFGGGMIMQNGALIMKSSMMFKQFNRRTKITHDMLRI